jgi:hypothetical protein
MEIMAADQLCHQLVHAFAATMIGCEIIPEEKLNKMGVQIALTKYPFAVLSTHRLWSSERVTADP